MNELPPLHDKRAEMLAIGSLLDTGLQLEPVVPHDAYFYPLHRWLSVWVREHQPINWSVEPSTIEQRAARACFFMEALSGQSAFLFAEELQNIVLTYLAAPIHECRDAASIVLRLARSRRLLAGIQTLEAELRTGETPPEEAWKRLREACRKE